MDNEFIKRNTVVTESPTCWSFRDYNLIFDKIYVKQFQQNNMVASRIFLTGEVDIEYIGEMSADQLIESDTVNIDDEKKRNPLFILTKQNTIRMSRFDPKFVWNYFGKSNFKRMVSDESTRLGIDMVAEDICRDDYYEAVMDHIKDKNGEWIVPILRSNNKEEFYQAMYLACLLIHEKPGYMGVHVSTHFAVPETAEYLSYVQYRKLSDNEIDEVIKLEKYQEFGALSNPEIMLALNILEGK